MNIDAESIALLSLILRDAPQDRQFILCVLARSNQVPSPIKFYSNTEYPTFYGYYNERMPFYLMGKNIISNVPRQGMIKRLISSEHLAYTETAINNAENWDLSKKLEFVSKFITVDNQTGYKDAGVYLVFRDKAMDHIKKYIDHNGENISGFLKSKIGRAGLGEQFTSQPKESATLEERYNKLLEEIKSPQKTKKEEVKSDKINRDESSQSLGNWYKIDEENTSLTVNDKEFSYQKDGRVFIFLKKLIKNKKYLYFGEVSEEIDGAVGIDNPKNTYYEVCRGIENRLAKKGITGFLEYNYNRARINPLYKKLKI